MIIKFCNPTIWIDSEQIETVETQDIQWDIDMEPTNRDYRLLITMKTGQKIDRRYQHESSRNSAVSEVIRYWQGNRRVEVIV